MDKESYEILAKWPEDRWRNLILRLGRYAVSVSRRLQWRTGSTKELPGGETVDSIVSKAIEKLFSGERNWDTRTQPDLEKYLMDVIDSLLNHLAESQDNKLLTTVPDTVGSDDRAEWEGGSEAPASGPAWLGRPTLSPEAALIEREQRRRDDMALEMLIDDCSADPVLTKVLEAMFDGCEGPAEIARAKELDRNEVYNAAKRLDRKIAKVRELLQAGDAKSPAKRI